MLKKIAVQTQRTGTFPTEAERRALTQLNTTGWLVAASPSMEITSSDLREKGYRTFTIGFPNENPYVNYYALQHEALDGRKSILLFDSGPYLNAAEMHRDFTSLGLDYKDVRAIFLTHGDLDHVAGAELPEFQTIPQFISTNEQHLVHGGRRSCLSVGPVLPDRDTRLFIEDTYRYRSDDFPHLEICVLPTAGHTEGSLTYRIAIGSENEKKDVIYATGDAVRLQRDWLIGAITDINSRTNAAAIDTHVKPDVTQTLHNGDRPSLWTGHTSHTSDPAQIRSTLSISPAQTETQP
jgi:glyoxylase-like metal-dependent hydrolase (beta-lactamase superfamily II)